MKAGKEHRVPLSDRAVAILAALQEMRTSDFGTFRDWASETTSFPHEVCEQALAHTISNKTEAAYRRGDLFDKRARLMSEWAKYCDKDKAVPSVKVVTLR